MRRRDGSLIQGRSGGVHSVAPNTPEVKRFATALSCWVPGCCSVRVSSNDLERMVDGNRPGLYIAKKQAANERNWLAYNVHRSVNQKFPFPAPPRFKKSSTLLRIVAITNHADFFAVYS